LIVLSQLSYLFIVNGSFGGFGVYLWLYLMSNALPFQVLLPFSCECEGTCNLHSLKYLLEAPWTCTSTLCCVCPQYDFKI